MTEAQIDEVVVRCAAGEGVEHALQVMGLNSSIALEELKKHPTARTRLKDAKLQAQQALTP